MSKGVNKVIIIGWVKNDPDIYQSGENSCVVSLVVETVETWTDKETGNVKELPEAHNIVLFGDLANKAATQLKCGNEVYIDGRIQTKKYEGAGGKTQFKLQIIANNLQIMGLTP